MENNMTNEQPMSVKRLWHWACCILPILSLLFWLASIFFVVLAWISIFDPLGVVWGYGPQWWIYNTLMFGILALYGGRRKMGCHCDTCTHAGMCKSM